MQRPLGTLEARDSNAERNANICERVRVEDYL
jgi:hypothetical protein